MITKTLYAAGVVALAVTGLVLIAVVISVGVAAVVIKPQPRSRVAFWAEAMGSEVEVARDSNRLASAVRLVGAVMTGGRTAGMDMLFTVSPGGVWTARGASRGGIAQNGTPVVIRIG